MDTITPLYTATAPLPGAIRTGAHASMRQALDPRAARIVSVGDRSAAGATGLVADLMDFARARSGGGVPITPPDDATLAAMVDEVIAERRTTIPTGSFTAPSRSIGPSSATPDGLFRQARHASCFSRFGAAAVVVAFSGGRFVSICYTADAVLTGDR